VGAHIFRFLNQATLGVEGFVFDGRDGSQMAFWTCSKNAGSAEHVHDYDEYMLVVQGCYTLIINGKHIPLNAGEEYFIPPFHVAWHTLVKWLLEHELSTPSAAIALTANDRLNE
jgi:quercetin dioxygenase-like cupin family protein